MTSIKKLPPFSGIEISSSEKLASSIDPSYFMEHMMPFKCVENEMYQTDFSPRTIKEHYFLSTSFQNVVFTGTNAYGASFDKCTLDKCKISDANFKGSKFTDSRINVESSASSFELSDFSNAKIYGSDMSGCSFSDAYFSNAEIADSKFVHSEFIATIFDRVTFKNCDFAKTNLDYAEFSNVSFSDVTLPYWGILHTTKGLPEILSCSKLLFSSPDSSRYVGLEKYLEEVQLLYPYFYKSRDFISLVNLYLFYGRQREAYDSLIEGLRDACQYRQYKQMKHLCRIASFNRFFSRDQLRQLYLLIENNLSRSEMSYMEYKNYLLELDSAKRLLIDNPFDRDSMSITLETKISNDDYRRISSLLMQIDNTLAEYVPQVISYIEVRHNSPIEIVINASGLLAQLILAFALIDVVFDKTTTYIERVQNILLNKKQLRGVTKGSENIELLEAQLAEIREAVARLEQSYCTKKSAASLIINPEELQNISYTLFTKQYIPSELLVFSRNQIKKQ